MDDDVLIIALVKGRERYIIIYDQGQEPQARHQMCRWATDPQYSFSWLDAGAMNVKLSPATTNQE